MNGSSWIGLLAKRSGSLGGFGTSGFFGSNRLSLSPSSKLTLSSPSSWSPVLPLVGSSVRGMATKKSGGSTRNNPDNAGRRLGIKVWSNCIAKAGNIIVRQRGTKFRKGYNVGIGKDHTLFARCEGIVKMTRLPTNKRRNVVHVVPPDEMEQFLSWVAATPLPPQKFERNHHIRPKPLNDKFMWWNTKFSPKIRELALKKRKKHSKPFDTSPEGATRPPRVAKIPFTGLTERPPVAAAV